MIRQIIINLEKGKTLLTNLSQEQYVDKSIPPYYSSIGGHMRHILDMFHCVFLGIPNNEIDLTLRERNINVETLPNCCEDYFDTIIDQLKNINITDLEKKIEIIDDLGGGKCAVKSTLGAVLAQAHSHAIHHYATIGYMMYHLGIVLDDNSFGVNPTTPKENLVLKS